MKHDSTADLGRSLLLERNLKKMGGYYGYGWKALAIALGLAGLTGLTGAGMYHYGKKTGGEAFKPAGKREWWARKYVTIPANILGVIPGSVVSPISYFAGREAGKQKAIYDKLVQLGKRKKEKKNR